MRKFIHIPYLFNSLYVKYAIYICGPRNINRYHVKLAKLCCHLKICHSEELKSSTIQQMRNQIKKYFDMIL